MTTGTLTRSANTKEDIIEYHSTVNCKEKQQILDEQSIIEPETSKDIPAIYYDESNSVADKLYQVPVGSASGRLAQIVLERYDIPQAKELTIWDSDKLKKLLAEPVGYPVELTAEEAKEIVLLAAGRRPDLPSGNVYVRKTRELLGHSLIERIEKSV